MTVEHVARDVLSRCEVQIANYREYRKRSGADFNVFKIVNRATDEVHGHSAFIAELLNPNGSHGQGSIFLNLFFETLGIQKNVAGIDHWQVAVEASRGVDGRIDILLSGQAKDGRRLGIAIENKIYASDQERQLKRYWDYLNDKYGAYQSGEDTKCSYLLYYLTLDGFAPSEQSIFEIPKQELAYEGEGISDSPVRLISYAYHIAEWINACHCHLAAFPYAREVLAQYLDTVNALTGNGESMTDSLQNLLDTPEKLYAAAKLTIAVTRFKQKLVCDLWDMIQKQWNDRTKVEVTMLKGSLGPNRHLLDLNNLKSKSEEYFSKSRNVPKWFGLVANNYEYNGLPLGIEIRFDGCFYVGLYGVAEEKVLDKSVVERFYDRYKDQKPPGCKLGTVDAKGQKDRIYVSTSIRFDNDNEGLFQLVHFDRKKELVDTLFKIIEGILAEMTKFDGFKVK